MHFIKLYIKYYYIYYMLKSKYLLDKFDVYPCYNKIELLSFKCN